jgi:hypothetical protein
MTQAVDYTAILAQGSKQKSTRPPIVLLYGEKKLGKTTFASQFPKPAFICGEDGAHSIADNRWPSEGVVGSWPELLNYTRAFAYGQHPFKTLVIDTLGPLSNLCLEYIVRESGKGSWEKMGWGKEEDLIREWRVWLSLIEYCRNKREMAIVQLAHAEIRGINNTVIGDRVYTFQGEMHQKLWGVVSNWVDILLYGRRDSNLEVPKQGRGKPREVFTGDRWIFAHAGNGFEAGVRAGYWLPAKLPLSYEAFADEIAETAPKVRARIEQMAGKLQASGAKTEAGKPITAESVMSAVNKCGDDIGRLQDAEEQLAKLKI